MKYRNYDIKKTGEVYRVTTPTGEKWAEVAVNRTTAKRWVDAHIAEQATAAARKPDVFVRNEGSIFLVTPISEAAREWMKEHIPDDAQYMGRSLVVEHRYVEDIINGMKGDGLRIK